MHAYDVFCNILYIVIRTYIFMLLANNYEEPLYEIRNIGDTHH